MTWKKTQGPCFCATSLDQSHKCHEVFFIWCWSTHVFLLSPGLVYVALWFVQLQYLPEKPGSYIILSLTVLNKDVGLQVITPWARIEHQTNKLHDPMILYLCLIMLSHAYHFGKSLQTCLGFWFLLIIYFIVHLGTTKTVPTGKTRQTYLFGRWTETAETLTS